MFLYANSSDFVDSRNQTPKLISSAFVRTPYGLKSVKKSLTIVLDTEGQYKCPDLFSLRSGSLLSAVLNAVPILGNIRGLARLYSVWAVKDRSKEAKVSQTIHTVLGILETLGLGILVLIFRITTTYILSAAKYFGIITEQGVDDFFRYHAS
ncbi:hypothetical protein [Chlamydia vaughanii]|uniref:hypothetical protein n=1 Tax=Chlamydia vaughanii TaxID=3112552 RepID=UPI0032B283B8